MRYISATSPTVFAGAIALLTAACDLGPQWQNFSSELGQYTISIPGEPRQGTQKVPISDELQLELQTVNVTHADISYLVSYLDYPPALANKVDPHTLLSQMLQGAVKTSINGEVIRETEVTVSDVPCRRFEAKGQLDTKDASARGIFCYQESRLYQVLTIGETKDTFAANATQFLDSFKITRAGF